MSYSCAPVEDGSLAFRVIQKIADSSGRCITVYNRDPLADALEEAVATGFVYRCGIGSWQNDEEQSYRLTERGWRVLGVSAPLRDKILPTINYHANLICMAIFAAIALVAIVDILS